MQRVFSKSLIRPSLVVSLSALMGLAVVEAGYVRPSVEKGLFCNEMLTLDVGQRREVASILAALVRNFPGSKADDNGVRARAVAIALRLDPTNRDAITANGMFARGLPLTKVEGMGSFTELTGDLNDLVTYLTSDSATQEDRKLGHYLQDIGWRVDPNGAAGRSYQVLLDAGNGVDWDGIVDAAVDDENAEGSSEGDDAKYGGFEDDAGLVVEQKESPQEVLPEKKSEPEDLRADGSRLLLPKAEVSTMVSAPGRGFMPEVTTLTVQKNTREWKWVTGKRKEGDDKKNKRGKARQEWVSVPRDQGMRMGFAKGHNFSKSFCKRTERALRELQKTYKGWPKGLVVEAEAKYYGKVSGSLGALAALVGVDSMISGVKLAPDVAYVGSFDEGNGKLIHHTEVPTVLLRLDEKDLDSVRRLVVPQDGEQLYVDILASANPEMALRMEVMGASGVRHATRLGSEELEESEARAVAEFAKVQALDMRFRDLLSNRSVLEKLQEVVDLCPSHLSARALLTAAQMQPYGRVTLPRDRSVAVMVELLRPFGHMVEYELDAIRASAAEAEAVLLKERLSVVRRKLDRGMSPVVTLAVDFSEAFEKFTSRKNRSSTMAQQTFEQAEAFYKELQKEIQTRGGTLR
ncbi:hypothetical protein [Sulfuriroseicoccus oceanibius]|uniref:Uncharacterized protein n=1 Tax=Sulfuriroseicoccus oceanibius TaxID=2707525 RepID=A0A6B3LAP2_9BACT|nr:hypothetical protein [Sulfuriroseicoccus oceanibius]QQL45532.1 hypothetical protein G3M56_002775 [Sulfuriroseicoccus oceanibius]